MSYRPEDDEEKDDYQLNREDNSLREDSFTPRLENGFEIYDNSVSEYPNRHCLVQLFVVTHVL